MAGHSQFKNIMHRKGRQDKVRSKLFGKLAREITTAAKLGQPDPAFNPRLRAAILAARAENVPKDVIDQMYKPGAEVEVHSETPLAPNEFVLLKDEANPSHTAMGRLASARGKVVPLFRHTKDGVWGVRPRNMEQSYALDLLLNDEIKLVTIVGKAGTADELMLKVLLAASHSREHALEVIAAQRDAVMTQLQRRRRSKTPETVAQAMVTDALVVRAEADLRWLDLCEERLS